MKLNSLDKETAMQIAYANQVLCKQYEGFFVQLIKPKQNNDSTWSIEIVIKPNDSMGCVTRELEEFCEENHQNIYLVRYE